METSCASISLPWRWGTRERVEPECLACGWSGDDSQLTEDFPGWRVPAGSGSARVARSAKRGCLRCKIIVECWKRVGPDARFHHRHDVSPNVPCWELFHVPGPGDAPSSRLAGITTYEALPSGDTSSRAALMWATAQLRRCNQKHLCRPPQSSFRPSRVIDVGAFPGSQDVVVVDGKRMESPDYITLSHCWGAYAPACKTTRASLPERQSRVPWTSLPRTFQDTIALTRWLNKRYLWIDTLCILQDDVKDWLRESRRMHGVYKSSYLTIAAASAHDGRGGLFAVSPQPSKIITLLHGSLPFNIYARPLLNHIFSGTHRETNEAELPLLTRGWVFQERLLAPRVLYFTQHELVWECHEACNCECKKLQPGRTTSSEAKHEFALGRRSPAEDIPEDETSRWHTMVKEYTDLKLTEEGDILPALAGIAREVARSRSGETYLAGLWSGSLREDLMWFSHRGFSPGQQRPQRWCAPTWSWASLSPSATFFDYFWGDGTPLFHVEDASCQLVSDDVYGPVSGGRLVLRARLLKHAVAKPHRKFRRPDSQWYPEWVMECGAVELEFVPDVGLVEMGHDVGGVPTVSSLILLAGVLATRKDRLYLADPKYHLSCLVIRETRSNTYQRVGLARLQGHDPAVMKEFYQQFGEDTKVIII
ncbi:heterokaryon incompatibility protein-domain-containing protein [Lasiosphaeria hispida]|uniref:Heterokaryon incompatibility protein-domain-containing protein n=1 Tax=Lasiosphaeria hispida TaxID=260671 RepID=A0AAJ0MFW8_9PEZI|nr:heterokaryon incompatibility protein-domain-containing protein [Lasiosphaeria hispida]